MGAIPPSEGAHVESYQPTRKPGCRTQSISGRDWRNSSVSSGTHLHLEGTENEQIICNVHKSHVFYRLTLVSKPVNKRFVHCCSSCWDKKLNYLLPYMGVFPATLSSNSSEAKRYRPITHIPFWTPTICECCKVFIFLSHAFIFE